MRKDFVQISGDQFTVNGEKILLRGFILGSWMNLEHFMMGLPGTHSMIQEAFGTVYGADNAKTFFDSLIKAMVKEEDIAYLKQMGTNTVRIPFGYHYFIDDLDPHHFLAYGFEMLDRVLSFCERHKLYAILDLHSTPGGQNNDWHSDNLTGQSLFWKYSCFQEQVCGLWKELAHRYADNPWVAGYDLINEPGYGLSRELFNGFYRKATKAIREEDPDHVLFLEGDDFGRSFDLFDEPDDPQSTYAMHYYPFVLEEDILNPDMPEGKRTEIYDRIFHKQITIREKFRRPIWCGETGYNIPEDQEAFYAKLLLKNIQLCEGNNVSWSIWTYKDARRMGIVIPRKNSPWMELRKKIETQWTHEWEQAVSNRIIRNIGETYYQPLDEKLAYDLEFSMRSILHRIAVEQILKPRLCEIPWEEIVNYPDSFAFENCDKRLLVIDKVSELICGASI